MVLANQNAKLTGPDQGFLVSPLVLTRKPWERGCTKLPLHYMRRESTLDVEDFGCDRCLFEMDRPMFDVEEIIINVEHNL